MILAPPFPDHIARTIVSTQGQRPLTPNVHSLKGKNAPRSTFNRQNTLQSCQNIRCHRVTSRTVPSACLSQPVRYLCVTEFRLFLCLSFWNYAPRFPCQIALAFSLPLAKTNPKRDPVLFEGGEGEERGVISFCFS